MTINNNLFIDLVPAFFGLPEWDTTCHFEHVKYKQNPFNDNQDFYMRKHHMAG